MKTVPIFLFGLFRNALRLALQEATAGSHVEYLFETRLAMEIVLVAAANVVAQGARERSHSRDKLARRLEAFAPGECNDLLNASRLCDDHAATARMRGGRRAGDEEKRRALRALALTQM